MNIYDLWFSSVKLSNKSKLDLMKKFKTTEEIWISSFYSKNEVLLEDEKKNIKYSLKKAWDKEQLKNLMMKVRNKNIEVVTFNDDLYPKALRNYDDCPSILFYKGDINKLNEGINIAIVGSRNCTIYGRNAASLISKELSINNINIISGMARGIDTYAHKGTLENGGYTCAVLGSGIDVVYPKENKRLYDTIVEKGCIISEFLPSTKPLPYNFPVRNRIISGLSSIVIIVEASEKSGSLVTASLALEQGKEIVSVPGSIFSEQSKGTNKLIRDGAYPFTDFEDLFRLLGIDFQKDNDIKINKIQGIKKRICDILGDRPIHIDDIFKRTNIDIKQLYELLFELQLENVVICLSGNYYVKVESRV